MFRLEAVCHISKKCLLFSGDYMCFKGSIICIIDYVEDFSEGVFELSSSSTMQCSDLSV